MALRFGEVAGQQSAKQTLFNAFHHDRLSHAWLFHGPPGVGKLQLSVAFAQLLNCHAPSATDSCGTCPSCHKFRTLQHPDVHWILPIISRKQGSREFLTEDYLDRFRELFLQQPYMSLGQWLASFREENKQAQIPIAEIRSLKQRIYLKTFEGPYRVILIWHADRMNAEASNALLKVLEEPPEATILILTATDTSRLLPTILSRCQQIQMPALSTEALTDVLYRQYAAEYERAVQIAHMAQGSLSAALEILNLPELPFSQWYMDWMRMCFRGDLQALEQWSRKMQGEAREYQKLFLDYSLKKLEHTLLAHIRQRYPGEAAQALGHFVHVPDAEHDFILKFSQVLDSDGISAMQEQLEQARIQLTRNVNMYMVYHVLGMKIHHILKGAHTRTKVA